MEVLVPRSKRMIAAPPRGGARSNSEAGGADRNRTGDPLLAKQVLSQLSYSPGNDGAARSVLFPAEPAARGRENGGPRKI